MQVQDLIISAAGSSRIAAEYGCYIMKELEIFNSVSVFDPAMITPNLLTDMKYGGLLTVSQSGSGKDLIDALKLAYRHNLTCFNLVNVESSPITQVINQVQKEIADEEQARKKANKATVLYDASDSDDEIDGVKFQDKNIGIYQKSGHCYSDIKSFIPQIVTLTLVALWFSDYKQRQTSMSFEQRKPIVEMRK